MSMCVGTVCVTCRLMAPSLGDEGYIGRPSPAEHSWDPEEEIAPSFGYIFLGLESIGMVSWELTRYRDFLVAHSGHQLRLAVDEDAGAASAPDMPPPAEAILAAFEQKCYDCRRRRSSQIAEWVLPRAEQELAPADIDTFIDRVPGSLGDASYHAAPFGDDEASRVASFLQQHRGHRVCSSFVPEAERPA